MNVGLAAFRILLLSILKQEKQDLIEEAEAGYLDISWEWANMGLNRCDARGARLWINHLQTVKLLLYKKSFHKGQSIFLICNYD